MTEPLPPPPHLASPRMLAMRDMPYTLLNNDCAICGPAEDWFDNPIGACSPVCVVFGFCIHHADSTVRARALETLRRTGSSAAGHVEHLYMLRCRESGDSNLDVAAAPESIASVAEAARESVSNGLDATEQAIEKFVTDYLPIKCPRNKLPRTAPTKRSVAPQQFVKAAERFSNINRAFEAALSTDPTPPVEAKRLEGGRSAADDIRARVEKSLTDWSKDRKFAGMQEKKVYQLSNGLLLAEDVRATATKPVIAPQLPRK